MTAGTKFRPLARLLDSSTTPLWVIGPDGKLIYLSAGVSLWLGIEPEQLLDRRSVAGSSISDDPLDYIAASMSPPPGFSQRGTASLRIQPPPLDGRKIEPLDVRFVRIGEGDEALTIAVAGSFRDQETTPELRDAVAVRRRLDWWRKRHFAIASVATAGVSSAARRLRARLHVAASTRTHIGFFGPEGCGAESIAARIHQESAAGEPIVTVDGSLMDAELLDASVVPLVNQLASSSDACATVLVRGVDTMPSEAGLRLAQLLQSFSGRLRLLAICGASPKILSEPLSDDGTDSILGEDADPGIITELVDFVSAFTVTVDPLASRVEDIPVMAAALVDAKRAAGEGTVDRISRTALDSLVLYPWPGNFVELDDAIRYAMRTATGQSIAVENLPLAVRSFHVGNATTFSTLPKLSLDESLKRLELRMIQDALQRADGNRAEAARDLGISRARLLRRLDEIGETPDRDGETNGGK